MPVSNTKGTISMDCVNAMVYKAFGCTPERITELTEGYFNIAYRVELPSRSVILKVAPPDEVEVMTYEKNIMFSEVDAMRMAKKKTSVPVPEILFYDDSHTVCDRSYYFMEQLPGQSFSSCMEQLKEEERDRIFNKIGQYTKELNQLTGTKFGYYCQTEKQGENWYTVFRSMLEDAYTDAKRKEIPVPVTRQELFALLEHDRALFEAVTEPRFVHWDIWAGNVFVHDGKITGIIDFERCLWADELMEVGFRTYDMRKAFLDGYGRDALTKEQLRRAKWYDIYLFLVMHLECDYRDYDNRWAFNWSTEMLQKWTEDLRSENAAGR